MLQIKIIIVILSVLSIGGGAWYVIKLIGDNAVLESTLASTTAAFGTYATNVESEVEGYATAVKILGERDQETRGNRDEQFASIENRDLEKMARRHPATLVRILTGRTARLLGDLSGSGRSPADTKDASTDSPGQAEPETD